MARLRRQGGVAYAANVDPNVRLDFDVHVIGYKEKESRGFFGSIHKGLSGVDKFTTRLFGSSDRIWYDTSNITYAVGAAIRSGSQAVETHPAYRYTFGPGTLYDRTIVQPFYSGVNAFASSPLGDPGLGIAIEQSMVATPYTRPITALGTIQRLGVRSVQALNSSLNTLRAEKPLVGLRQENRVFVSGKMGKNGLGYGLEASDAGEDFSATVGPAKVTVDKNLKPSIGTAFDVGHGDATPTLSLERFPFILVRIRMNGSNWRIRRAGRCRRACR